MYIRFMKGILMMTLLFFILCPSFVFAHDIEGKTMAGTDTYLREAQGYTEEMLSTSIKTEDRDAFKISSGEGDITDPLGDVLNRFGQTSTLHEPWGDISSASLKKNDSTQMWDVTVHMGGLIPAAIDQKAQLAFYADVDDNTQNNAPSGIRINSDAEFSIEYSTKDKNWHTDFRWYNQATDFWAIDKDTKSTFEINDDTFILHIPYSEIRSNHPSWRVIMALSGEKDTEIDSAQDVGFPPAKGTETNVTEKQKNGKIQIEMTVIAVVVGAVLMGGLGYWKMRRRK